MEKPGGAVGAGKPPRGRVQKQRGGNAVQGIQKQSMRRKPLRWDNPLPGVCRADDDVRAEEGLAGLMALERKSCLRAQTFGQLFRALRPPPQNRHLSAAAPKRIDRRARRASRADDGRMQSVQLNSAQFSQCPRDAVRVCVAALDAPVLDRKSVV